MRPPLIFQSPYPSSSSHSIAQMLSVLTRDIKAIISSRGVPPKLIHQPDRKNTETCPAPKVHIWLSFRVQTVVSIPEES